MHPCPRRPVRPALRKTILTALTLVTFTSSPVLADQPLLRHGQPIPSDEELLARFGPVDTRSVNHVEGGWLEVDASPTASARFDRDATGLAALLDDSPDSYLALGTNGPRSLTSVFGGAAEWTNQLEVTLSGDATLAVDVLLPNGKYHETGATIALTDRDPFVTRTEVVDLAPAQVQGVRLRVVDQGRAEIKELGAYWNEPELAKDAIEIANEYAEDYPGTNNDLSSPDKTVKRMSNYLSDRGWTYLFSWGDNLCWEQDYKNVALGGTNDSWIDATDMFVHCSHGTDDALFLANSSNDDALVVTGDITNTWGNRDLEWAWIHCCLNMKTLAWHNALDGAHTISGWKNVINSSADWGKNIAQHLVDDGVFDSARTIVQSWWSSNSSNQPAGNIARLLAEDNVHYNEYIFGQGPVQADSNDSQHWWWEQTVSKSQPEHDIFFARTQAPGDEPVRWEAPPGLGRAGQPGLTVYVHPSALDEFAAKKVNQIGQFEVLPSGMDTDLVAQRLARLCEILGDDCPTLVSGREGEEAVAASAGLKTMTGALTSGAMQYTDNETFQVPLERRDFEIDPDTAVQRALQLLQTLEFGPQQWMALEARTNVVTLIEGEEPDIRVIEQVPASIEVVLGQMIGEQIEPLPLLGPGGRTHVMYGPDGNLQSLAMTAREFQLREVVAPVAVEDVLDQLAAFGFEVVDTAPEFPASQVTVLGVEMGYLERGAYEDQPVVGAVYALDVEMSAVDPRGRVTTSTGQLWVAADTAPVQGTILEPQDGATFGYGQEVRLAGEATGGTPPYDFEWYSSSNDLLGTGPNVTTTELVAFVKGAGNVGLVTVELRVTDAHGNQSSQMISLVQGDATSVAGTPRSRSQLLPAAPNPFNPRTVLAFDLDRAADVTLAVYDVRGRRVQTLIDGESVLAGRHSRVWDGTDTNGRPVAAGVYLYRVTADVDGTTVFSDERKMSLVK